MVAISQWILGIRPEHDGLRVEPVLPVVDGVPGEPPVPGHDLRHRRATGSRRLPAPGSDDPAGDRHADVSIIVDGRPIDGTLIPLPAPGTPHVDVEVRVT